MAQRLCLGLMFSYLSFLFIRDFDHFSKDLSILGLLFLVYIIFVFLSFSILCFYQVYKLVMRIILYKRGKQYIPDHPWTWLPNWRTNTIFHGVYDEISWQITTDSFFLNLLVILTISASGAFIHEPRIFFAVLLIIFLTLLAGTIYILINDVKSLKIWKKSFIKLDSIPVFTGKKLWGTIEIPSIQRFDSGIQLRLHCLKYNDETEARKGEVLWEAKKHISPEQISTKNGCTTIPVEFSIPEDVPETELRGYIGTGIKWLLEVNDGNGEKLGQPNPAYEIPIFASDEESDTENVA